MVVSLLNMQNIPISKLKKIKMLIYRFVKNKITISNVSKTFKMLLAFLYMG